MDAHRLESFEQFVKNARKKKEKKKHGIPWIQERITSLQNTVRPQ